MGLVKDIKHLISGLGITGKHLGRHAVTLQYPEEKMVMPERSRGVVVLLSDKETGELNCTACMLCQRACPTGAIVIEAPRDEAKKRHLKGFIVDFGLCCYCGLCEEACNFCAIKLAPKYEFSTYDRSDSIWDMKKLQEVGRDVDYVDTRKKKPTATAPKLAAPKPPATTTGPAAPSEVPPPSPETSAPTPEPPSDRQEAAS